jgi:S-formylglutathione hydrolase
MESYVTRELVAAVEQNFPVVEGRRGIFGHSMGGHGALTLALRHPHLYRSVSAFAPIVAPSRVPWGQKAFQNYLGSDRALWEQHDATALAATRRFPGPVLIDQGDTDKFLDRELQPSLLVEACRASGQAVELRMHEGYDHSYFFIASLVEDHLRHHARALER